MEFLPDAWSSVFSLETPLLELTEVKAAYVEPEGKITVIERERRSRQ